MNRRLILTAAFLLTAFVSVTAFAETETRDFSNTPRDEVPVEYTWNLNDIYPDDETWRADLEKLKAALPALKKKAESWTGSAKQAYEYFALDDELTQQYILLSQYANLSTIGDISDSKYTTMAGEVQALGVQFSQIGSGLREQVLGLGEKKFAAYLKKEPRLEEYAFDISEVFRGAAHALSGEEQRIVDTMGLFSGAPYTIFGLLNDSEIPNPEITLADGSEVVLNMSAYQRLMESKVREDRILAGETFWRNRVGFANSLAAALDAGAKQHLFGAQISDHGTCLEAALFDENIDTEVYHNTIRQVRSRADLLQRYLVLKKEMLGLDSLRIEDGSVNAVASVEREYGWDDAEKILAGAFEPLGPEYGKIVARAFDERWIDRYPNRDKQSGAFSSMVYGVHPYIKMNYQGQYSEVGTLAHELGHAVQSYLSCENQPFSLHDYPSYVSEVASTFNEHMLNRYLLKTDTDPLFRLYLMDEYMKRARTLVYFAVMMSELEVKMHETVEAGGTVTGDFMNENMLALLRHYYGHDAGVCEVPEHCRAMWSVYPHLFMNYYLLSYCNGFIASMAASEMVLQDENYRDSYLDYLKAGGSDYSLELLKIAKIDLATAEPFDLAFAGIERVLDEMETLVAQLRSEGKL